jgi:hypothetical protein
VPYLRLTADRRGYEHTFLLHVAAPGAAPRVLYWYRTAPGLRIGRPPLDDAAMRALEDQYPDIDFDWPYILEMGAMTPVDVEAPVPQRRRKPRRPESDGPDEDVVPTPEVAAPAAAAPPPFPVETAAVATPLPPAPEPADGPDLLAHLLGRGIAAALRGRHRQLASEVAALPDPLRETLSGRLRDIDPDRWTTPDAVLAGMARIDAEVEAIRQAAAAG